MEVVRITKEFNFEMAHALYQYDGPCKNIHGHSYQLSVTIKGRVIQEPSSPKNGMVIDFSIIKNIIEDTIIKTFDHTLVLSSNSKKDIILKETEKIIFVDYQPTCENLLIDFANRIQSRLDSSMELHHICLRETKSSYAEWYLEDNKK